jgi:hypothetical protein
MRSAGSGSKGDRFYRWAFIAIHADHDDDGDEPGTGEHLLLIRRNDTTGELAYHHCYTPPQVPPTALVWVAGQRWRIEESFQTGKGLTGLDQHQVRRWTSWHRWSTLAMLAHAFLVVATADQRDHTPTPAGLIALTVNEFRHLFDALLLAPNTPSTTCCTAPTGAEDTKPEPAPATTGGANNDDHDLRL